MANYFVIGNTFKPYSFDELIKPYQIYGEAYKEQEQHLQDLNDKLGALEGVLGTGDTQARRDYESYIDESRKISDNLATEGLSRSTRAAISNLRSRYAKNISPIIAGAQREEKMREELRKAMLADPSLLVENPLTNATIDDFIANPNLSYGRVLSKDALRNTSSKMAKALAKQVKMGGEAGEMAKSQLERILPYQYRVLEQTGFTEDDVVRAITSNEGALAQLGQQVLESSGVLNWNNAEAVREAQSAINEGLYDAIGETKYHYLKDDYALQLAEESRKHKDDNSLGALRSFSTQKATEEFKAAQSILDLINEGRNPFEQKSITLAVPGSDDPEFSTLTFKSPIINKKQQELLTEAGVTEQDSNEVIRQKLAIYMNNKASKYSYSSVNLNNLDIPSTYIMTRFNDLDDANFEASVREFKNDGTPGKGMSKEDFKLDTDKVTDIHYGMQNPEDVLVTINNTRYLVKPDVVSEQFKTIVDTGNATIKQIQNSSSLTASQKQLALTEAVELTTELLRKQLVAYNKGTGNTLK